MAHFILKLEFDINQITRSLQWKFAKKNGKIDVKTGPLAGTCHFMPGDLMDVQVTATGNSSDNLAVKVTDCTMVSLGTADIGKFALSPFSETQAVTHIDFPPASDATNAEDSALGRQRLVTKSESSLKVVAENGQWEFSGYLSVQITIDGQDYYRVFYFDPEGSTGNGGGTRWP